MMVESGMEKGMSEGYERLEELVAAPTPATSAPAKA